MSDTRARISDDDWPTTSKRCKNPTANEQSVKPKKMTKPATKRKKCEDDNNSKKKIKLENVSPERKSVCKLEIKTEKMDVIDLEAQNPVAIKTEQNVNFTTEKVNIKSEKISNVKVKTETNDDIDIKNEKDETSKIENLMDKKIKKSDIKLPNVENKKRNTKFNTKKSKNVLNAKAHHSNTLNSQNIGNKFKHGRGIDWESSMLAEKEQIDFTVARNVINMFNNDCTIPFIARYRREVTKNMDADTLRRIKNTHDNIKSFEAKAITILKKIEKMDRFTPQIEYSIYNSKSIEELEFLYAPFKQAGSRSKAEKARELGLKEAASILLNGSNYINIESFIQADKPGLKNSKEVIQGIENILADVYSKDEELLEYLQKLEKLVQMWIVSKRISNQDKKVKSKDDDMKKKNNAKEEVDRKFELYYDFRISPKHIQSHQVLALNRGESLKILNVKIVVSDWLMRELHSFCVQKWFRTGIQYPLRTQILEASFADSYNRLIVPLIVRRIRSDLNQKAQNSAIESFAMNLKSLLQTPPVRGCPILGIDPGFRHGCKFALISGNGEVLWTTVMNLDINSFLLMDNLQYLDKLKDQMIRFKCELIALGNGTGCREMENIIGDCIKQKFFEPELNVQYTIVNERGASIYSCTELAKAEFPKLDPNLISAVFIARSLQDPLSEYVKVEPKHLGVGMYQHDMPEKQLNNVLNDIVVECVSFTGVDVNTASAHLLQRIAGLTAKRAANIIDWRLQNGPFTNRKQLTLINGIGTKTFEQCSGFIRINPQTISEIKKEPENIKKPKSNVDTNLNPLDRTWIHPESYDTALAFMKLCKVSLEELGTPNYVEKVKIFVESEGIDKIASLLKASTEEITLISEALMKPLDYDYRSQFAKPIFRKGLTSFDSLQPGMILTGCIGNVTNFGAFVDVGVGKNGLIHCSKMNGKIVQVGDRVEVEVIGIEVKRGRLSLLLIRVI